MPVPLVPRLCRETNIQVLFFTACSVKQHYLYDIMHAVLNLRELVIKDFFNLLLFTTLLHPPTKILTVFQVKQARRKISKCFLGGRSPTLLQVLCSTSKNKGCSPFLRFFYSMLALLAFEVLLIPSILVRMTKVLVEPNLIT